MCWDRYRVILMLVVSKTHYALTLFKEYSQHIIYNIAKQESYMLILIVFMFSLKQFSLLLYNISHCMLHYL